jgi:DNA-binding response OmpR family regulator
MPSKPASDPDRILIVEDDPQSQRILRKIFAIRGWRVDVVGTVADALASLQPAPGLIILDLSLADGDGEDVLRRVRERGLETYVAITSGELDPARVGKLLFLKPDVLMPKPVELARLIAACDAGRLQNLDMEAIDRTA